MSDLDELTPVQRPSGRQALWQGQLSQVKPPFHRGSTRPPRRFHYSATNIPLSCTSAPTQSAPTPIAANELHRSM